MLKSTDILEYRQILGERLFKIALDWSHSKPVTKKEREQIIRDCRGRKKLKGGITRTAETVEMAATKIARLRIDRDRRTKKNFSKRSRFGGLPEGTLANRLQERITTLVHKAFRFNYRYEHIPTVQLTTDPTTVGVTQSDELQWDYYSKKCKYPKKHTYTTITVPRAWLRRVFLTSLADVDGLATLDAQKMDCDVAGIEVYHAIWIVQSRGYQLDTKQGYIARIIDNPGLAYHGNTLESAIRGAQRKSQIAQWKKFQRQISNDQIAELVDAHADKIVRISDARKIGACEYGIQSWCNRVGIDYSVGEAPLSRVWSAYLEHPLPEARRTVLWVLRDALTKAFCI